jgi:Spy/CpxP family protein refolding chaperone
MKNSLRLILSLAGLALLTAPILRADEPPAPPADKPEHHRERGAMMERVAKELGLTADQEAKWKEIGQQEKTAMEALRADASLSKEDRRAKAMETNKTFGDQRRAILNADQQKKFDEMRAKMRERGPRGEKGPGDKAPDEKAPGN